MENIFSKHFESIYYHCYLLDLLLLFCFLSNLENLYLIKHDYDVFYDTYNAIDEPDERQFQYLLSIPNYFGIYFWMICKDFYNFNCFIINHVFLVITFWMHYTLFIFISRKVKLITIVNRIFHVSDFLRLFMISLKYGLIL